MRFCLLHVRGGVSGDQRSGPTASSLLHVRGGVSGRWPLSFTVNGSSPRPWRCFLCSGAFSATGKVFSTSVEVFPNRDSATKIARSLLHVRGGVSDELADDVARDASSPRPWRCFSKQTSCGKWLAVFSTSVEVFLQADWAQSDSGRLLHVRGGVSCVGYCADGGQQSSPRPWRCFRFQKSVRCNGIVFSTSVEVFLDHVVAHAQIHGLLHVRGGVSSLREFAGPPKASSPRPWRCFRHGSEPLGCAFVFSTSVEVFPASTKLPAGLTQSSPRPWRCFQGQGKAPRRSHVFSTSVEVFRSRAGIKKWIGSLLYVRGGVSSAIDLVSTDPRVFSTSVEVFP